MLNNTAIDVVIGLAFVYALYSLLASAIKEIIASLLSLRGRMLVKAVKRMLEDDNASSPLSTILSKDFFNHDMIKYMSAGGWLEKLNLITGPSYISSGNFAKVMVDVLKEEGKSLGATTPEQIRSALTTLGASARAGVGSDTATLLLSFLEDANNDLDKFRARLEQWFNDMMDRASGWYKRQVQAVLLVIGFILAVAFNANTFEIEKRLANDNVLREKMAQSAVAFMQSHPQPKTNVDSRAALNIPRSSTGSGVTETNAASAQFDSAFAVMQVYKDGVDKANSVLGLGWNSWSDFSTAVRDHLPDYFFGWLITAIAISMGAPFWFDVLSKFIQLRGTGPKPTDKVVPASKDGKATLSSSIEAVG